VSVLKESQSFLQSEPRLKATLTEYVFSRGSLGESVASVVASKLYNREIPFEDLFSFFSSTLKESVLQATASDLYAVRRKDPAVRHLAVPLLFFKGFQALQAYRVANALWKAGQQALALWIQSRCSEVYGVDVHPAATLGPGMIFDHATGIVIGETAVVGSQCTIFHQVTLGSSGGPTNGARRHPVVGDGCVLGSGCKVLGAITLGDRVKVGGNSVVVSDVPSGTVAVGVPSRIVGRSATVNQPVRNGALITTDPKGLVLSWNLLAVKMFGYTAREAVGQQISSLIIPSPHREAHAGHMANYVAGRTKDPKAMGKIRKVVARRKNGQEFEVNLCLSQFSLGASHIFEAVLFEDDPPQTAAESVSDYII
jgi:serine O-acetyltransferase